MRAERRTLPDEPGQSDRRSYVPRDMLLSLLQAEHEEHLDREHPEQITTAPEPRPMGSRSVEPFSEGRGRELITQLRGHLVVGRAENDGAEPAVGGGDEDAAERR